MPSDPEVDPKLIMDLLLDRIPESEFLAKSGLEKESIPALSKKILTRALAEKDPDAADSGMFLLFRFGYGGQDFLSIFNALALEPWHREHEDIVFELGMIKDPSSVPVLAQTAVAKHKYLENDDAFALGSKSIYALRNIGTPEAVEVLADLARSPNEILRKTAIGRLKDLATKNPSESIRSLAASKLPS